MAAGSLRAGSTGGWLGLQFVDPFPSLARGFQYSPNIRWSERRGPHRPLVARTPHSTAAAAISATGSSRRAFAAHPRAVRNPISTGVIARIPKLELRFSFAYSRLMRTEIGILGAGRCGLRLAHLLARRGSSQSSSGRAGASTARRASVQAADNHAGLA